MESSVSDDAFAQYLHRTGMARAEQIEQARQQQAEAAANGVVISIGEALVQLGIITEAQREDSEKNIQARQAGPKQLGNYRLIRKLGEGGMGAVYLAEDTMMRRPVALKLLLDKHASDERFVARFRREVRAIGNLNHPNIVMAYAVGEELGQQYFVMEYCDGEPLDAKLKREGRIPEKEAIEITIQTARGLQHAHEHGFIHRDIKPGNIFIARDGTAKILDMGLSKDVVVDADSSFNTQSGMTLGTPHYVSPEQAEARRDLDGRTDIYSLGSTLFHLVVGRTPYSGTTLSIIASKITKDASPDPRKMNPDLSHGIVAVIHKMMAKEPGNRYPACGELIEDLERIRDGKPPIINDPATQTITPGVSRARPAPALGPSVSRASTKSDEPNVVLPPLKRGGRGEELAPVATPNVRVDPPFSKGGGRRSNAALYAIISAGVVAALFIGLALGMGKSPVVANGDAKGNAPAIPVAPPAPAPSPVPAVAPVVPPPVPVPAPVVPPPAPVPTPPVVTPAPSAAGKWTFLSDLKETVVRTLTANYPRYRHLNFNKGRWGQPDGLGRAINVNKVASPHGLAMYPESSELPAEISYLLGKQYQALQGSVGIDDEAYNKGTLMSASPLTFSIVADGKKVWTSKALQHAGESQEFNVAIAGVDKLHLTVACAGNSDFCMGAWIEPRVQAAVAGVYLSDLSETDLLTIARDSQFFARWCFGKGKFGQPNSDGEPISVKGTLSPHGLAMNVRGDNSDARVSYVLSKRYQTLSTDAAINDSANRTPQGNTAGSATALNFRVFGDGKELWHSRPLQRGGDSEACSVDVSTVEKLELVVECPGSWWRAQGVWVEPRLIGK